MFEKLKIQQDFDKLSQKLDNINDKLNDLIKSIKEDKKTPRNTQNQSK